ncbi:MAG: retropepsin-like domain-containing protein [Spirochaetaceae bacterium]|jgi:hypothetical protein|nr:retropepsin-like domain-containing protein [Spirochaetaceae bacterium]
MTEINTIVLRYPTKPLAIISDVAVKEAIDYSQPDLPRQSFDVRALWDTGAQICAISKPLVESMGLQQAGTIDAGGFGGDTRDTPFYRIDLTLNDDRHFYGIVVIEYAGKPTHDIIIGLNVITAGDFSLFREGSGTRFTFTMDT